MGMSPSRPRPRVPLLLASLLLVAGAEAAQPQQVNGVLGGSVLLSPTLPPNKKVKEIEWSFSSGAGTTIQVAEFGPGGFKRPDPKDRFRDRLEMFNETALEIRALERGDSGVYGARVILHPALVEDRSFNLSVYGPVQAPEIQHQLLFSSTQGCNVSLQCRVPDGSGAEAAWELGRSLWAAWEELREDKRTLILAVPAAAFNSCYTCVARNPIQERNVSICLDTVCRQQENNSWPRWHVCLVLLATPLVVLLSIAWWWRKKRKKKAAERATPQPLPSEDALMEPQYTKIQIRTPLEAYEEQNHPTTIYSEVQAGADSGAKPFA